MQVLSCLVPRSRGTPWCTHSLGTCAYNWSQALKIFRKVQLQIANRSITRARLLGIFAGGCKTLQGRRWGCCLHSSSPACSESEACEPAVFFCRCRHLTMSHLIVSSGEQSQLPFIFLRALVLAAVGNKTTFAQVPDRKWVWNYFALNRSYNDLASSGWLSQANALCLDSGIWVVPERLCRWLHRIWHSSGKDAAFLSVSCLLCISLWPQCSDQTLVLSEQMKCHPGCVPVGQGRCSQWSPGSVCWFLALAHPWSCCGSCCVQAPKPLALEVSGFPSWCPGVQGWTHAKQTWSGMEMSPALSEKDLQSFGFLKARNFQVCGTNISSSAFCELGTLPGLDYIPSCFLISADQTLPSAHRNPSLSSSDICTS